MNLTKTSLFILILFLPFVVKPQTGPAGIAEDTSLVLWLNAGAISNLNEGNEVSQWNDLSGNGNHAVAADDNFPAPKFYNKSRTINNQPVVYFSGNKTELKVPDSDDLDNTQGLYMLAVAKVYDGDDVKAILGKRKTYDKYLDEYAYSFFFWNSGKLHLDVNDNAHRFSGSSAYSFPTTQIMGFEFDGSRASAVRSEIFVNNKIESTGSNPETSIKNSPRDLIIGTMNHNYGKYTEMELAEIIIFRRALKEAEQNILNNSLSAKYDIPLQNKDVYLGDKQANGDFDFGVTGIGKDVDGSSSSAEKDGISITAASGMDSYGDYIMAGHKVKNNSLIGNLPELDAAGVDKRWERVWYFNKTDAGNNAKTTLTFDFSKGGLSSNVKADPNLYKLLTRNGQGNWVVASAPAGSVNGDRVIFHNVDIIDGNQYTLGMMDSGDGTLPVELLSFAAVKKGEKTRITWQTASEHNNDLFILQRATDHGEFTQIGNIQGSGNSNQVQSYSFTDEKPQAGVNYYRLKQVDFDGKFEYFGPLAVKHKEKPQIAFVNYDNQLQIDLYGNAPEQGRIEIYSVRGEMMYSSEINQTTINISTANLSNAIYIVRILAGEHIIRRKVYLD